MDNSETRVVAENNEQPNPVVPIYSREMASVALTGVGVGIVAMATMYLLNMYVFTAVMCRDESVANCADAPLYAMVVAMIIGAIGGLVAMVQARIYRPLLVVLTSTAALWGFQILVEGTRWYWGLLITVILFALTYSLFAWIARIRSFSLALVVSFVLVIAVRLMLNS